MSERQSSDMQTSRNKKTKANKGRRRKRKSDRIKPRNITSFKGATTELEGKVFQLPSGRRKNTQFRDTVEALKVYCSTQYKQDIRHLSDHIICRFFQTRSEEIRKSRK